MFERKRKIIMTKHDFIGKWERKLFAGAVTVTPAR